MKNSSLIADVRWTIMEIAVAAVAATILPWAFALVLYNNSEYTNIYPANAAERRLPEAERFIAQKGAALLERSEKAAFEAALKGTGISYQVADSAGSVLYGNKEGSYFSSEYERNSSLNKTKSLEKNSYLHLVPILDTDGRIVGTAALFYELKMSFADARGRVIGAVLIAALASPLLYIVLFTLIFSRRLVGKIDRPLKLLTEAAENIKEKNLDFTIPYRSENELGRLCAAFAEMRDELKRSLFTQWEMERERSEMVQALAHDLKTPVSIIRAYAEALLEQGRDEREKQARYLSVIRENAEKCGALVGQMQIAAELESDRGAMRLRPFHPADFLAYKVEQYALQAGDKNIRIRLDILRDDKKAYLADTEKLERILDNIISNSLRYTPENGTIVIAASAADKKLAVSIQDTGPGFDKEELKRALERFYRGDKARRTGSGHTGLGLYIAKQLAEQMGGGVALSNAADGGAKVDFFCRLKDADI